MSKKRNLAVLMAAATVATSVAPVFADTTASLDGKTISAKDSAKLTELKNELSVLFNTRYTNDKDLLLKDTNKGKCVYDVKVTYSINGEAKTDEEITTLRALDELLAKFKKDADTITVNVVDKGHKEVDGNIVDNEVNNYKLADINDLKKVADIKADLNALTGIENGCTPVTKVDSDDNAIYLTLQNNPEKVVIKSGVAKTVVAESDKATAQGIVYKEDSFGNKLDEDGKITKEPADYVVLGFESYKEEVEDKQDSKKYIINNEATSTSVTVKDLYNNKLNKFTQEGNEVARFISDYNDGDGTGEIEIDSADTTRLVIKVPHNKNGIDNKFTTLTVTGTVNEITNLKAALNAVNDKTATPLDVLTLAGLNREATSIEVSKEIYKDTKAKNVVLVSGYAVADGLAATPFAKLKEAPVLLTGKDKISDDVMDEIDRVMESNGTVYLVGGTNSLSTGIEKQLDAKFIDFERIAGTDRMSTSLKIAQEMNKDAKFDAYTDLFVSGGHSEADAMSVAAVAAQGGEINLKKGIDPILLTDANGLTSEQASWINRQSFNNAYITGGENSVPTSVTSQLRDAASSVYRLAGADRQGTNAKVIKEFYEDANSTNILVAKADNNGLVDALPAGVLAADKKAPVVLANDNINSDQTAVLKSLYNKGNLAGIVEDKGNKVQAGYGIADKVWESINKILKQKQD